MINGKQNKSKRWPGLFRGIRPVTFPSARRDLLAGITLAAMNVPQAMGYARIAGMPVVTGLYTLLLPMIAFALFASSRYLVVAADSATAAILAAGLAPLAAAAGAHYVALAAVTALLTAGFLLLARLFKLGFLADFLSQTVLVGFLTGVGIQVGIAVSGQMLGLHFQNNRTVEQLGEVIRGLPAAHRPTIYLSVAVVAVILLLRKFAPRLPGPLIAVAGAMVAGAVFDFSGRGIALLGPVAGGLPHPCLPPLKLQELLALLPVAGSCFIMILAQSAATARAYATRHQQTLDENADLVGLSAANMAAAFSGAFVVNGSPTQTAMVERSGGRSQFAQLATAGVVTVVLIFFTGPLQYLPACALGAVVFTIALGLIDVRGLRDIRRESPGEFRLAIVTAAAVVLLGVEHGILMAMALSLLRHVRHSYRPHTAVLARDPSGQWKAIPVDPEGFKGPDPLVFRFGADLFYANAGGFANTVLDLVKQSKVPVTWLVLDAAAITSVDYSAARVLFQLHRNLMERGVTMVLVHAGTSLLADLQRHRLSGIFRKDQIFDNLQEALARFKH